MSFDKYNLRNTHSVSLLGHFVESNPPEYFHIRNSSVLVNRSASYPALVADNSVDLVRETHSRRSRHDDMYTKNSKVFAR